MLIISRRGCRAHGSNWCREELWQQTNPFEALCDPKMSFFRLVPTFFLVPHFLSPCAKLWLCNWAVRCVKINEVTACLYLTRYKLMQSSVSQSKNQTIWHQIDCAGNQMLCDWAGLLVCLYVSCLLGPGVTDFDEITVASKLLDSRICHLATQWKDPFLPCWALCGISIEDQVYCHLVISLYLEHFTSTIHLLSLQVSQNSKGACSGRARPPEISWENCSRHLFQTNLKNAVLFKNYRMQIFFRMKAAMWRIWQIILLPQTCCQLGAGTHFGIALGRGSGRAGPWSRPWWIWKRAQTGRQHGHRHENTVFSSFHHFFNFVQRFFQWFFLTISPLSVFFISGDGTWAFVHDVPLGWGAGSVAVPRWDLQRQNIRFQKTREMLSKEHKRNMKNVRNIF